MMASVSKSTKVKDVLHLNGFIYHFHSNNVMKTRKYWRCEKRVGKFSPKRMFTVVYFISPKQFGDMRSRVAD